MSVVVAESATLLPDRRVLIGTDARNTFKPAPWEIYDPTTQRTTLIGYPPVDREYFSFTATLLRDGRVLIAGGHETNGQSGGPPDAAFLFDPSTNQFATTGSLNLFREAHTATLLADGKVLIAGGFYAGGETNTAELYDPASGTFAATGSMADARFRHHALALQTGQVLIVGGEVPGTGANYPYESVTSVEVYQP